jgi:hypothetical protein
MMPVKRTNSYTGNTVYRLLIPGFPSAAQQALAAASYPVFRDGTAQRANEVLP